MEIPLISSQFAKREIYHPKPGFCCFGIVDECFLRCKMCQKWKPDPNIQGVKIPSVEHWKNAITSLSTIVDNGFLINFGGGEALLMRELLEVVRFAAKKGFRTNIASNGYLINEDIASGIADSGLSSINLSLDSMNTSTHDFLRGVKGTYERVMRAIVYLDKCCPKDFEIIICCAIYGINMGEVLELSEWVNRHPRIKWVYFMAAMQPNNTGFNPTWYKDTFSYLWPQDTVRINSVIDSLIDMKKSGYKINNQICQLEAFKKYFNYPDKFVKKTMCNLDRAVHISSVGNIYICYDWETIGNIMQDNLAAVWHSFKAEKIRDDIRSCKKNCHHLINCWYEEEGNERDRSQ